MTWSAVGENSKMIYFTADNPELVHQMLIEKYPSFKVNKLERYESRQSQVAQVLPEPIRIKKDQQGQPS
ncbi:hypothetical protein [Carnobacterium jeotgali]|uniref:hypothetical protein n=1 Tax=Carnobacterium jeotgali TaxID=545534 RepID=UPI000493701A|nr:hypothetical protein [Carnobacterium jeotgali]